MVERTARRAGFTVAAAVLALLAGAACSRGEATTTTEPPPRDVTTTAVPTTAVAGTDAEPRGSVGCGTDPDVEPVGEDPPGDVALTFASGGSERIYRLGVPRTYAPDRPAPLILNLHGSGSNAVEQAIYSDLPRRGAERGFLTVTPEAIGGKWELPAQGPDDEFLMSLLDDVERRYCIDLDRVHAVGMSLGAWKSAVTACAHPDRFASVALVTVEVHPPGCGPVAVVAFHGTADETVPYGEGSDPGIVVEGANAGLPGSRDNIASWAAAAGCSAEPDVRRIGPDVELRAYPGCDQGIDVELYTVEGGGHSWPGAVVTIAPTTQTIDATELSLDWFEAHPRREG